jgi:hypothetical protein
MGNRYFLNVVQRKVIITETAETESQSQDRPYGDLVAELSELDNRTLVDLYCGENWLGFKGQSLELA